MMKYSRFCGVTIFILLSIGLFFNCRAFDLDKDLIFRLYTSQVRDKFHALNARNAPLISASLFNPKRKTRIFVHGFLSSEHVLIRYKEAYLKLGDFNFIGVDWRNGAKTYNYFMVRSRVPKVAEKLAALLDTLVKFGLNLSDVTIVGHSLGSHIAGLAAKQLKSAGKIGCIIGLDPASVRFNYFEKEKRLADSDAEYVQIIHTDGDKFGFWNPLGHADFYPNAGHSPQPGCPLRNPITNLVEKCSHVRAHHLFLESLINPFPAIQCESHEEIKKNQCTSNNVVAMMGGDITPYTPKAFGIFYLETNDQPPFSKFDHRNFNKIKIIPYQH